MIIMRRIILAFLTLALTGCEWQQPQPRTDAAPAIDNGSAAPAPATPRERSAARTVLFVGTSLTAGYGVGAERAYPAVLQQMIDSAGLPFRVVNAGISGETSAGGLRRIDWSLQQPADVLVLELGANDALRGLDPGHMRSNLDAILARARELHPRIAIVIAGMEAPPNLGADYARRFRDVFTDLARQYDAALVPFLLEGVAAEPSLNLEDGIHPNVEGHRRVAGNVWVVVEPVLRSIGG
jgi:acyl-CoA thioesterase I